MTLKFVKVLNKNFSYNYLFYINFILQFLRDLKISYDLKSFKIHRNGNIHKYLYSTRIIKNMANYFIHYTYSKELKIREWEFYSGSLKKYYVVTCFSFIFINLSILLYYKKGNTCITSK
ncbi:hypothetical protein PFNF54_01288 [Plasmodium falciparum NF54]|uniref:Uncharacterized protein n=1 Tax=Plasmodium falciparum (isolate NF54) TaxID=5843 RepID=W7KK28_PLAFO|nr:hypothetical protein PFNF54_01288 [Plasmodium falciparum NF54]